MSKEPDFERANGCAIIALCLVVLVACCGGSFGMMLGERPMPSGTISQPVHQGVQAFGMLGIGIEALLGFASGLIAWISRAMNVPSMIKTAVGVGSIFAFLFALLGSTRMFSKHVNNIDPAQTTLSALFFLIFHAALFVFCILIPLFKNRQFKN